MHVDPPAVLCLSGCVMLNIKAMTSPLLELPCNKDD